MKIKTLLCSGFAAVCTVMAVQVVIAYWQLNLIDKAVDRQGGRQYRQGESQRVNVA